MFFIFYFFPLKDNAFAVAPKHSALKETQTQVYVQQEVLKHHLLTLGQGYACIFPENEQSPGQFPLGCIQPGEYPRVLWTDEAPEDRQQTHQEEMFQDEE